MTSKHRPALLCALSGWLLLTSACSTLSTDLPAVPQIDATAPPAWQAPLPHGASTGKLQQWWQSLGDPLLVDLIAAAEDSSPTLASASARLAQSRAARGTAQAANRPTLDANLLAQRGINQTSPTVGTVVQGSLDASWEMDLFGANRASAEAADARFLGAQANWHAARVSVAAEVASQYFGWRTCQQLLALQQHDANSRVHSAELTMRTAYAGLAAPASAALANAAAAEAQVRLVQLQNQCDGDIKALVALTGMAEPALHQRLQTAPPPAPDEALLTVDTVPAQVLAQRPDIYAAERDVAAASADLGAAQAQRYPRLSIGGSIGALNYTNGDGSTNLGTWSIGPVALNLPLFDGGRRTANVDAAQARYTEAVALYRAKVRDAAREVEVALLSLSGSAARKQAATAATDGYRVAYQATQARTLAGSANQLELEDAQRALIAARSNLHQIELERTNAWIALYRALGGGWNTPPSDAR